MGVHELANRVPQLGSLRLGLRHLQAGLSQAGLGVTDDGALDAIAVQLSLLVTIHSELRRAQALVHGLA